MYVRQLIVDFIVCITLYSVLAYGAYLLWWEDEPSIQSPVDASGMICYIPNASFEHVQKNTFYEDN